MSTNVPGPQIPLYLGGRRLLLTWIPLGICATNVGLFVAILSYHPEAHVRAHRRSAPRPRRLGAGRVSPWSFAELRAAARSAQPAAFASLVMS